MDKTSFIKIRQKFSSDALQSVENTTVQELERAGLSIAPGASIAIAVGSRGIADLFTIVRTVVKYIQAKGGKPFIIPAMGSHGNATARGQAEVLSSYGISSDTLDVPVADTMDVIELSCRGLRNRVYISRPAFESDGIILINRVKPHTDFKGRYESGLVKMAVIGLGKHAQALEIHKYGIFGLRELIPQSAKQILATGKILMGIAVIENFHNRTLIVEAMRLEHILEREPQLLDIARKNVPFLPVKNLDVLIVDKMGKDISGVGMDPDVIGRIKIRGEPEPDEPVIHSIVVSDLTEKTKGNALGVGLADVITRRLFQKIHFEEMYRNVFASTFLERAKIPVIAENDRDAYRYAVRSCGCIGQGEERVVRIQDTQNIAELYVSESVYQEICVSSSIEKISGPHPLFENNNFHPF